MNTYIGIDIGGTKCSVVEADENGKILNKEKFLTLSPDKSINKFIEIIQSMNKPSAIGISCGSPLDSTKGIIQSPPNLIGWDDIHIVEILKQKFNVPVFIQNDADACALAEWKFGAGRGTQNMIFLTCGTGLGAGLILNGRLYSGTNGCAGEIGHVRLSEFGPSGYGKMGSCEGFGSGSGIAKLGEMKAIERFQSGKKVSYCHGYDDLKNITAAKIAECANNGNEDAIEVFTISGKMLGRGIAILIDVLNPEMIVIGSVFTRSEHLMRESLEQSIREEALDNAARVCSVMPATLGESLGDIAAVTVAMEGVRNYESKSL